jgi:acyl transferase domain-containing protein/acyl carrier protein
VPFVLAIGTDTVLSSISRNVKIIGVSSICKARATSEQAENLPDYPAHSIAVTGMSCKLPGADSPDEFWQLLLKGTSMVEQVPLERWPETVSSRGNKKKEDFWGNFMQDVDAFDHQFFNKSSREAASMDPQQRLLLQGAYEAMESAGYFFCSPTSRSHDIGCYLGLCAVEYDTNVGFHSPNAFSTTGTLRAFLSGKISHFFGWTGPSLTFDTACSSSAVAIHTACRALQADECTQALAGGVSLFTSPYFYENLSASHFLSPTGASKPFDAKADGYCRGEGFGLVVLKKLSAAVADGDDILAVIGGSAVNQNDSCVPITVPNASSQETLYRKAAQQAGITPHQVSFVESHGTGTPVGDPIEMESIRHAFGGPHRRSVLAVSSVKGNIGHLEGASGVAGLIKAILQLEHRTAVRQASFQSLNPRIPPLGPDHITVPTSTLRLPDSLLTACVNNYGAAGSNCTLMIAQPPRTSEPATELSSLSKYPILIAANSEASVEKYCKALRESLQHWPDKKSLISNISFHLARRHNGSLPYIYTTAVSNTESLKAQLTRQLSGSPSLIEQRPSRPSMILVCGGQVRKHVGLSQQLWEQVALLRMHLDACDEILRSMGYPGIYPAIFQSEPIADVVVLHSTLFALQYASAKAWIDCGLAIDAIIGHSLGQLTALSVSGILSLEDGLKFVAGRASLIKTHWGLEAGSMILVEADLETLSSMRHSLEIACYNGPSSHVLVGDKASVNDFEELVSQMRLKAKTLQVTNGFHSKFTEPLIAPLWKLASSLRFHKPAIPIETCSDGSSWLDPTASCLAEHTRKPVFFGQAVQRLASARGICTWLEAGSESGVTNMARHALDSSKIKEHSFLHMSLSEPSAVDAIVDNTIQLWKIGHTPQFWAFHRLQKNQYYPMRVPSYQWEKNKHWLELLPPPPAAGHSPAPPAPEPEARRLVRQIEQRNEDVVFTIDPQCDEYRGFVSGHVIAGSPLCPGTLYMEIVTRACKMLVPWEPAPLLAFSQLQIGSPLGMAADLDITMILRARHKRSWEFNVMSCTRDTERSTTVSHMSGIIELQMDAEAVEREFSRYERLIRPENVEKMYEDADSESVRGPMLYQVFSRVVQYSSPYRGLKSVAAKMGHIVGTVVSSPELVSDTVLAHPAIVDSWMQVAGIHANGIRPCPEDEVYVFTKLERIQFGPEFKKPSSTSSSSWIIFSNLVPNGPRELLNDIFVFDANSKCLVVLILGAQFNNVRLSTLQKVLSRLNAETQETRQIPNHNPQTKVSTPFSSATVAQRPILPVSEPNVSRSGPDVARDYVFNNVCACLERVAEIPCLDTNGNASMDDLGIDSLMVMEVISELSSHFNIELSVKDVEHLTTLDSLVSYLLNKGCGAQGRLAPSSDAATTAILQSSSPFGDVSDSTANTGISTPSDSHDSPQIQQLASVLQEILDMPSAPSGNVNLAHLGLDSLQAIELANEIKNLFSVSIDLQQLDDTTTFQDLARLAGLGQSRLQNSAGSSDMASDYPDSQRRHSAVVSEKDSHLSKRASIPLETVTWKQVDGLELCADIYYPSPEAKDTVRSKRPVGRWN